MPEEVKESSNHPSVGNRRALTPDGREKQLINLAENLAEQQLRDGTASSQVITHYLKLGTERERLERIKIERDIKLSDAKVRSLDATTRIENMFADFKRAYMEYSGEEEEFDEELP